jgi:hypothetical protein
MEQEDSLSCLQEPITGPYPEAVKFFEISGSHGGEYEDGCNLVEVYRRFRGTCCLHHRPDDGGIKYLLNIGKLLPDYTAQ